MQLKQHARLSIAPMMDWTDRHCRYFHRLLSRRVLLYTEMITAPALVRGRAYHLLDFHPDEQPVAVQLGGADPDELAQAAQICADHGYREINLNVGCPSDRVQSGCFGAMLMKQPDLVAKCLIKMRAAQPEDVTVKCRIGVDEHNPQKILPEFLQRIEDAGVTRVAIHARKAWLQGLSPKENRDIPPLDYGIVCEMKERFPQLHISLNGGLNSLEQGLAYLDRLDGIMYGRAAYHRPWDILAQADQVVFGETVPEHMQEPEKQGPEKTRGGVVRAMVPYIERHLRDGGKLGQVTRHMLGLFAGQPGARFWRRALSENAYKEGAGVETVLDALGDNG